MAGDCGATGMGGDYTHGSPVSKPLTPIFCRIQLDLDLSFSLVDPA